MYTARFVVAVSGAVGRIHSHLGLRVRAEFDFLNQVLEFNSRFGKETGGNLEPKTKPAQQSHSHHYTARILEAISNNHPVDPKSPHKPNTTLNTKP